MKTIRTLLSALILAMLCMGASCPKNKPAAPGQDAVVINAERAQEISLEAYKQLTDWEVANRAALPVNVSRAVDKVRSDFPALWRTSRKALDDYKAATPQDANALQRITAALNSAALAMNALNASATFNDVFEVTDALARLTAAVKQLTQ